MADERTRSEYRLTISLDQTRDDQFATDELVQPADHDRDALAHLLLEAYQGTIDDEGENFGEAGQATDFMLRRCSRPHSFVLKRGDIAVAMSLVVELDGVHYIDPVAVSADHKRAGLGRQLVQASLTSLAGAGVREVGAAITDGNVASVQLFASFGAIRIGPWPPDPSST